MRTVLLGLSVLFAASPALANPNDETSKPAILFSSRAFLTASAYQSLSPDAQLTYDYGVIDGFLLIESIARRPPSGFTKCLITSIDPLEVHAAVGSFISEHPDRLGGGMAPVVIDAISHWCIESGKK
jgi:hypothetical protein